MILSDETDKSHLSFIALALLIAFVLGIIGIGFGIPSEESATLWMSNAESRREMYKEVSAFVESKKWERSHTQEGYEDADVTKFRSYFNVIRSFVPDEQDIIKPLAAMNPKKLNFDPNRFITPSFLTYIVGGGIAVGKIIGYVEVVPDLGYYFENPDEFGKFYLIGRMIVLLFSMASIILVYLIGRNLFGSRVGAWSALFLSVIPLWTIGGHMLKPDIPGTFWILCVVFTSFLYLQTHSLKYLLFAGIYSGFAAGTKYNFGISVMCPLLTLFAVNWCKEIFSKKFIGLFALLTFSSLAAFLITNPYIVLRFPTFIEDFLSASAVIGGSVNAGTLNTGPHYLYYFLYVFPFALGWLVYTLSLLGFFASCKIQIRYTFLLLVFPLLHILLMSKAGTKLSLYILPVIPFAAIIAGNIAALLEKCLGRFGTLFGILVVIITLSASASEVKLFRETNPRLEAGRWISANVDSGVIGVIDNPIAFNTPPMDITKYRLAVISEPESIPVPFPEWIVVSEYRTRNYERLGEIAPRAGVLKKLEELGYHKFKIFKNTPSFLGIPRPRPEIIPEDVYHIAPSVTIMRRVSELNVSK